MSDDLICRLQERIRHKPSTDLECKPPIVPQPCLTLNEVEDAELELGFALPSLVRSLYLEVADGGFGPGWGILPMNRENQPSVVAFDRLIRHSCETSTPPSGWPEPFIRFCEWGGNAWSGIDCSQSVCPVLRFNPRRNDKGPLQLERDSLADWLAAWLDGEKLWERVE